MKIIFTGGGTMGHITPAVAIAEAIKDILPSSEILFVGRCGGSENEFIKKRGFKLITLDIEGISRKDILKNIKVLKKALKAQDDSKRIINDFKPDIVFGTGGYACWPMLSAAQKMKIPTAIHESNVTPGLSAKILGKKCQMIYLSSDKAKEHFGKRTQIMTVGTPVLKEFFRSSREKSRQHFGLKEDDIFILSFGGSGGAEKINEVITSVMKSHSTKEKKVKHLHAVGKKYYEKCEFNELKKGENGCKIIPYIDDMPLSLSAADIVVSRSGALSLAEISAVGVASILIPSPNVTGNHQFVNAIEYQEAGASIIFEEKNLTEEALIKCLFSLEIDKFDRKKRAKSAKAISKPNCANLIAKSLISFKKTEN